MTDSQLCKAGGDQVRRPSDTAYHGNLYLCKN
uniref:Uncharacterized protein n=1 Tax=Rhizophora mucronata TaxID=61149 RepID=A0A2P2PMF7_RHIMU